MRILFANDGIGDAGGVQSYLAAVIPALRRRGHEVALLHLDGLVGPEGSPAGPGVPHFVNRGRVAGQGTAAALEWAPDVAFSHNMARLEVDRALCDVVPVVKMMHGYFGTCVSGLKTHHLPALAACGRRFGPACLPIHALRRCGPMHPARIAAGYRWAAAQNALFGRYSSIVVASRHMRDEFVANGADPRRVHTLPLFPTAEPQAGDVPPSVPIRAAALDAPLDVLFLGRMTRLKGADVLVRAAAIAAAPSPKPIRLTLAGDGPERPRLEALASRLGVTARFTGWVAAGARDRLFAGAALLAVPSVWPEPFGLVGLEAALHGVPAAAFDVGGISEWLGDGRNGWLVPGPAGDAGAFAAVLVRAARNPDELARLGTGARAAAATLSAERHVTALDTVLAAACGSPPSHAAG
jgi:glycosyltransferase involved in cell wall biosynthesis